MEQKEILNIIELGEDSKHQFKQNFTNTEQLAAEMAAFANSSGGMLIVGVNDNNEIIGINKNDITRLNQMISNAASSHIKNPINPITENLKINDKIIMVITVNEGIDKPYLDNQGRIWIKSGADKRKVTSKEELRRLFQSSDLIYSDEMILKNTSINDIDIEYFKKIYETVYEQKFDSVELNLIRLFENLKLAENNFLNLAGLLLFGKNPELIKPQFCIKAVSFVGNDPAGNSYKSKEQISGKLSEQYARAFNFVLKNLNYIQKEEGFNSQAELEIPKPVIEELLVNAIIHRNYFISAPIRLFIFDNRIEIISPGKLPNNLTVENIKNGASNIRNPIITSFVAKFPKKEFPYSGIGTGILRSIKLYNDIEFINDKENELFKVIIKRPDKTVDLKNISFEYQTESGN